MILRTAGVVAALAATFVQSCEPACDPPPPPAPAAIVSLTVDGTGNGHGRGLAAWGAYGWAVNHGRSWEQILDHYYGGTTRGDVATSTSIRIRLMALDGARETAVISTTGTAMWNGVGYGALQAFEASPNVYSVYGSPTPMCPGSTDGWTLLTGGLTGPVTFTTPADQSSAPAGEVLGVCQPDGSVIHYRGSISAVNDGAGLNHTVDEVLVENYLRGVLSREVSTSWGNAGGGAGMHALWAMAVASRSFALSQGRYSYAATCDTSACQVYGGAAYRAGPTAPTSHPTVRVCETGNLTFECANTNAAVAQTAGVVRRWPDGRIVSTEYSASHGPRTVGGPFPAVDDPADDVPQNPNHRWTRTLDAAGVAARFGLSSLTAATTEPDPGTIYDGIWGNRVRLTGPEGTVIVSAWDLRNAVGLPSPGFALRAGA